jgi:hypothetical protein
MGGHAVQFQAGRGRAAPELEHEQQVRELRLRVDAPAAVATLALQVVERDAPTSRTASTTSAPASVRPAAV